MFKKILALTLSLVVCLGAMSLFGCGDGGAGSAAFKGDYKAAEGETLTTFAENVATANSESIDYSKGGYRIGVSMTTDMEDIKMVIESDMKAVLDENDKIIMAGKIVNKNVVTYAGKKITTTTTGNVWYADNYMYTNGTTKISGIGSETIKAKVYAPMDAFINGSVLGGAGQYNESFSQLVLEAQGSGEGYSFYLDTTDANAIKAKVVATTTMGDQDETLNVSATYYFIFDSEYRVIGTKVEMTMDSSVDGLIKVNMFVEPYSGSIKLPSNLDSYEEVYE